MSKSESKESQSESAFIYVKSQELKTHLSFMKRKGVAFSDAKFIATNQDLCSMYDKLLLSDLSYAVSHRVEIDLWNDCFKDHISTLQQLAAKSTKTSEHKIYLNWILDFGTGFYSTLLKKVQNKFMPNKTSNRLTNSLTGVGSSTLTSKITPKLESEASYLCQHCLVHLGDLARYRNQIDQAQICYEEAVKVCPYNGQPYNQLGLINTSLPKPENKLSALYFYIRSIALRVPFPAGATNLSKVFNQLEAKQVSTKIRDESRSDQDKGRLVSGAQTFVSVFLEFNSHVHAVSRLKHASDLSTLMTDCLTTLISADKLTSLQLVQIVTITIFELDRHLQEKGEEENSESLSIEETAVIRLLTDFLSGFMYSLLLPVYTIKQGNSLLDYQALPALKVCLDFINCRPKIVQDLGFKRRLQVWPGVCQILNDFLSLELNPDFVNDKTLPLPEDRVLEQFLPLKASHKDLDFKSTWTTTREELNHVRAIRVLSLGKLFSSFDEKILSFEDGLFRPHDQLVNPMTDLFEGLNLFEIELEREEDVKSQLKENLPQVKDVEMSDKIPIRMFSKKNVAMNSLMIQNRLKLKDNQSSNMDSSFPNTSVHVQNHNGASSFGSSSSGFPPLVHSSQSQYSSNTFGPSSSGEYKLFESRPSWQTNDHIFSGTPGSSQSPLESLLKQHWIRPLN